MLCLGSDNQWKECEKVEACALPVGKWKIDYENPDTIKNLITYMDMTCSEDYHPKMAWIGAVTLAGCLFGSVFLLPRADYYGRRQMIILFLSFQAGAMLTFLSAMITYNSFLMLEIACFIAGAVTIPLCSILICYVCELSTLENVPFLTVFSFMAEALTSILVGIYFKLFKDTAVFFLIVTFSLVTFLVCFCVLTQESPHFLFKKRQYELLRTHLQTIAWVNGYEGELPTKQQLSQKRDSHL